MLDHAKLVNIALFLERVPVTGKEALAWSETYQAVVAEMYPPPVDNDHVAPGCELFS